MQQDVQHSWMLMNKGGTLPARMSVQEQSGRLLSSSSCSCSARFAAHLSGLQPAYITEAL